MEKIFLLSPARTDGRRAASLFNPSSKSALARRLQEGQAAPLGEIFSFASGLYFRGKLAYARRFATGPVLVITSNQGLVSADTPLLLPEIESMAEVPIAADSLSYRRPLEIDLAALSLRTGTEFIFLGSLASPKYTRIILPFLGGRIRVPAAFPGLGDMARGALLLRAVAENRELEYITITKSGSFSASLRSEPTVNPDI